MSTILIILVLIFLVGGGGYYAHDRYGGSGLGSILGLLLVVVLVLWLVGGLGGLNLSSLRLGRFRNYLRAGMSAAALNGANPVFVVISFVFWFWLWGVPGTILRRHSWPQPKSSVIAFVRSRPSGTLSRAEARAPGFLGHRWLHRSTRREKR